MSELTMDKLVTFLKQNGFIFQGSEIYGGLANTWDYGPLGVEIKNNLKKAWWKKFVQELDNVGLDSSILMNKEVWKASGHIGGFSDPLTDCKECKTRHRADKLIEDFSKGEIIADGWTDDQIFEYLNEKQIKCPKCGSVNYTKIRKFNLMFKTNQGVLETESNEVYLRPETAQGIFVNFKNIQRSMRKKLPFGIGQIGKSFRNEITPGNFIFRTREFEQMELEFFCEPGSEMEWFNFYKQYCYDFLLNLGINKDNIKLRDHDADELSHYSNATTDIEYKFPFAYGELWGIASRTDFDLNAHQTTSKQNLEYFDQDKNKKYLPYVIEPSVGVDRLLLALLCDAYEEEQLEDDSRVVLKLHNTLAPYIACVLPLIKKYHLDDARELFDELKLNYNIAFDESGKIGKRYRRQDSIGTPICITVDDNTKKDRTVTIRHRDTMEQETIKIDELDFYIHKMLKY